MDIGDMSFPLFAGTIASIVHVISGPDHLAAVTPIVVETNNKVWKIGFFWGVGHLVGMLFISFILLLFKDLFSIHKFSHYSEQIVGLTLIVIGFWSFYRLFKENKKRTTHSPSLRVSKGENLEKEEWDTHKHHKTIKTSGYSLVIGIIHGFAGVSHFILLFPLISFGSYLENGQYLGGFFIGTIIAMTTYTILIGKISIFTQSKSRLNLFKTIRKVSGVFAIVIGIYWFSTSF